MLSPFFRDPVTGQETDYAELLAGLCRSGQTRPLVVRSDDCLTVFRAVLQALLADGEVLLTEASGLVDSTAGDPNPVPFDGGEVPRSHAELLERIRGAHRARIVLSTSGTTGQPRQVAHGIESLTRGVQIESSTEAVWGLTYHPAHMAGLQVFFQAIWNGQGMARLSGLDPAAVERELRQGGVTHLSASPSFYRLLLPLSKPCETVRQVTLGGEKADARLLDALRSAFPKARIRNVYASTEAGSLLASESEVFEVPTRLEDLVRVEDDELRLHRSLLGRMEKRLSGGDWYATGDEVEVVSPQPLRFRFIRRRGFGINVGGYTVDPEEVAALVRSWPGVREARVHGIPNSVVGEVVACQILPGQPGPDLTGLRDYLAKTLPSHKLPRKIEMVERLPKTRTGKLKHL